MNYEQDEQRYLDVQRLNDEARLDMAQAAARILTRYGEPGLKLLARASHKRVASLRMEAEVAPLIVLLGDKPTLGFDHLAVLRKESDPDEWAKTAADYGLSPADLRRAILEARRQALSPDKVLARANATSEKMKVIVDEAVQVGVLQEVLERAESAAQYAKAKAGDGR